MVRAMRNLTSIVFEKLETNLPLDVDKIVNYMQVLLRGSAINKYKTVLAECKGLEKGIAGDQWTLGTTEDVTKDKFWTWEKLYGADASGDVYLCADRCLDFEKDIWLESGKIIRKKHWIIFQDHVKYIHNKMVKPFRFGILQYSERVREMHNPEE